MKYRGIYRDDGIAVITGQHARSSIKQWLDDFQKEVDELAGNDFLQFTAEIWTPQAAPQNQKQIWENQGNH